MSFVFLKNYFPYFCSDQIDYKLISTIIVWIKYNNCEHLYIIKSFLCFSFPIIYQFTLIYHHLFGFFCYLLHKTGLRNVYGMAFKLRNSETGIWTHITWCFKIITLFHRVFQSYKVYMITFQFTLNFFPWFKTTAISPFKSYGNITNPFVYCPNKQLHLCIWLSK